MGTSGARPRPPAHSARSLAIAVTIALRSTSSARARLSPAKLDVIWWESGALAELACLSLNAGLVDEGDEHARAALAIADLLRDHASRIFGVGILAMVAAERGDRERAGRLWAVVEDEQVAAPLGGWLRHRGGGRGTDAEGGRPGLRPRLRRWTRPRRSMTRCRWRSTTASVPTLSAPHVLIHEKLDQATGILREQDVDLWLTLARETLLTKDPCLDLIAGTYCAWHSAFLVAANGERIAIVGRFDAPNLRDIGAYGEVVGYDESLAPHLLEAIQRLDPRSIALNYSTSDPAGDGLTHGLWLLLQETLAGTPYADRLVSSEAIVNALRGRKSPEEVRRIRAAVRTRRRSSSA